MKKTYFVIICLLLISMLVLSGCTNMVPRRGNTNNPENNKYFVGYQGVEMAIMQGFPPSKLYYYGNEQDNTFNVNVEAANIGSSFSWGAIFLSGYDPTMIKIQGIDPLQGQASSCYYDIGYIGMGSFGSTIRCNDFFVGGDNKGNMAFGFRNIFGPSGQYSGRLDTNRLFGGVDFGYSKSGQSGKEDWMFSMDNPNIDVEYSNHGRLMVSLFSGIDIAGDQGQEYLLEGDTYEYPGGEIAYTTFDGNIITWPPGLDQSYQTFLTTNCFLYATYAAPIVCIDPAPYSDDKKVCTPKDYSGTNGQGAPVAVTVIEQENTPKQAIFTIHVRDVGGGKVFDPGRLAKCNPYFPGRVTAEDLNIVWIGDVRVSGDLQRLRCTPHDFIRLDPKTKEGVITCTYELPYSGMRSAYQAPLVVELWYGYSKTAEKRVLIKRAI